MRNARERYKRHIRLIEPERWFDILRFASPEIDIASETSLVALRRADMAARVLLEPRPENDLPWATYAAACHLVLEGHRKCAAEMNFLTCLYGSPEDVRKTTIVERSFEEDLERQAEVFERLHEAAKLLETPLPGRNAKPRTHFSVGMLLDLWTTLIGTTVRTKKDFVEFAFRCLQPAGANVTRNSIVESLDRHVRPGLREKRQTRAFLPVNAFCARAMT